MYEFSYSNLLTARVLCYLAFITCSGVCGYTTSCYSFTKDSARLMALYTGEEFSNICSLTMQTKSQSVRRWGSTCRISVSKNRKIDTPH